MACGGCRRSRLLVNAYNNRKASVSQNKPKETEEVKVVYKRVNGRLIAEVVEEPKEE